MQAARCMVSCAGSIGKLYKQNIEYVCIYISISIYVYGNKDNSVTYE